MRVWEEKRTSKLRPPLPVPLSTIMVGLAQAHANVESQRVQKSRWDMFANLLESGTRAFMSFAAREITEAETLQCDFAR